MVAFSHIEAFTNRVASDFGPERIVLFGSHATGTADYDSDVDLLVVMPHDDKNWRMAAKIRTAIPAGFPLDLPVRQPDEMAQRLKAGDVLLNSIQETGRLLYEQLTADWVKKSEGDLLTAEREFVASPPDYDAAAYHAQQAAEKFLEACMIESDVRFPKTHDLPALLDLLIAEHPD